MSTIVQCAGCCQPPLTCGICNNADLFSHDIPVTISGFSGSVSCNCVIDYPRSGNQCECTYTFLLDIASVNGTYVAKYNPPSPTDPDVVYGPCRWTIGGAGGTATRTAVCVKGPHTSPGIDCTLADNYTTITHTARLDFWINSDTLQVRLSFGLSHGCLFFGTSTLFLCGSVSDPPTSFSLLWRSDAIPYDPSKGVDCLTLSPAFNLISTSSPLPGSVGSPSL